jgi:membrane protease YdiL (CAAX protease family)
MTSCGKRALEKISQFARGALASSATYIIDHVVLQAAYHLQWIPNENPCFFHEEFLKTAFPTLPLKEACQLIQPAVIIGGMAEEVIFRGLIQHLLLKKLIEKAIAKIAPQQASWVDTKIGKIFRITLVSLLFSGWHLLGTNGEKAFQLQATAAFFAGCILGAIHESSLGLMGAIGCHMVHNAVAGYLSCNQCFA